MLLQIFISTHRKESANSGEKDGETEPSAEGNSEKSKEDTDVDFSSSVTPLAGVWGALAQVDEPAPTSANGLLGTLPAKFQGLATPSMNPMSMQLSHEEVVVGCADGTI